jgi:Lar family restriction alleviation protein
MNLSKNNIVVTDADIQNAGYWYGELMPCPFCGSNKIMTGGVKNENTLNVVYKVFCTGKNCAATMHLCLGGEETIEECRNQVVKMWNKRLLNH